MCKYNVKMINNSKIIRKRNISQDLCFAVKDSNQPRSRHRIRVPRRMTFTPVSYYGNDQLSNRELNILYFPYMKLSCVSRVLTRDWHVILFNTWCQQVSTTTLHVNTMHGTNIMTHKLTSLNCFVIVTSRHRVMT